MKVVIHLPQCDELLCIILFYLGCIYFVFSFPIVVRCQSGASVESEEAVKDITDLGTVGEDEQDFGDGSFSPAPGVDTVCVFPKNSARSEYSI